MDSDNNIGNKIDGTLHVLDSMEPVKVSPFFKDKTMNVLFAENEEAQQSMVLVCAPIAIGNFSLCGDFERNCVY